MFQSPVAPPTHLVSPPFTHLYNPQAKTVLCSLSKSYYDTTMNSFNSGNSLPKQSLQTLFSSVSSVSNQLASTSKRSASFISSFSQSLLHNANTIISTTVEIPTSSLQKSALAESTSTQNISTLDQNLKTTLTQKIHSDPTPSIPNPVLPINRKLSPVHTNQVSHSFSSLSFQFLKGFLSPQFNLQKRYITSSPKSSGWGSYSGVYSGRDRYSDENAKKPEFHKIEDSVKKSASFSQTNDVPNVTDLTSLKSDVRKSIDSGSRAQINSALSKIESIHSGLDTELIELYLKGLMLTDISPEQSGIKLASLLRKFPLLASNLKISQLINSPSFRNQGSNENISARSSGNSDSSRSRGSFLKSHLDRLNSSKNSSISELENRIKSSELGVNPSSAAKNDSDYAFNSSQSIEGSDSTNPIHVVVTEEKKSMFFKTFRWLIGTLIYAFCILTFMNLLLEGSGVMKASTAPKAFSPEEKNKVTFSDVQGCDEAKTELQELVDFLKDPKEFTQLGGNMPKGVLLTGPPGTGKTLLARAVAGEASVPFFFMSGSEFDEIYVGVGSKRLRELFAAAREKAPSIIFIDEIDGIGSKRSHRDQGYMNQTLNQLLVELDGFSQSEGVIFIAATNFPESLDPALTRPGRFDRVIDVPLPDVRGRIAILKLQTEKIPLSSEIDLSVIARGTVGFSGADLNNLVNIAAIKASKQKAKYVTLKDLEYAKDKIIMGAERTSAVVTMESRKNTAYHEGGHALVAMYTPGALPLHKATIMPRGHALGVTVQLPEMDRDSFKRQEYYAMLDVCMGGYAAEQLIFGYDNVTSGSSNDLKKATDLATAMVTKYGMSDKVGHVVYSDSNMGKLSGETRKLIDEEIRSISEQSYARVSKLLTEKRAELDRLANALIEYETLDQNEIQRAVQNLPIERVSIPKK
ncbi:hypothetical protein BB560_007017 [Smittium megazygosporum]|uniref:AAA+ ATPase domain-containing protein n=1 Tax=Smittium megazygosporum TaxID=133381 RepID=A0A2T9XZD4_9FUNG|nr:hypothetical protein BB560_007017 [Smittium megazygosporum]